MIGYSGSKTVNCLAGQERLNGKGKKVIFGHGGLLCEGGRERPLEWSGSRPNLLQLESLLYPSIDVFEFRKIYEPTGFGL